MVIYFNFKAKKLIIVHSKMKSPYQMYDLVNTRLYSWCSWKRVPIVRELDTKH